MNKKAKLYGLPHCDSTAAAVKWFDKHGIQQTLHNYKTAGIGIEKLNEWSSKIGWEKLLNKRSTTWRSLSKEAQEKVIDEPSAINAMLKNTSLIKRPVIESATGVLIGFDEKLLAKTFG
jgi:arsenate reductase (glutaredoxin)